MKIVVASPYYAPASQFGGPVACVHELNRRLRARGHMIRVHTTDAGSPAPAPPLAPRRATLDDVEVAYHRHHPPRSYFLSPTLWPAILESARGADVVVAHMPWTDPTLAAAFAARRHGAPLVLYTHGTFTPWALRHRAAKKRLFLWAAGRRLLERADRVVTCNREEDAQLARWAPGARVVRLPWGADPPPAAEVASRAEVDERWPPFAGARYVLFLGRLHPIKGVDLLVQAFARARCAEAGWRLVLAGPDEDGHGASLDTLIHETGLGKSIHRVGPVHGRLKHGLVAHADLFALTSRSEGFSISLAEALAAARPCVITETCYADEVGAAGAGLVARTDVSAIADALRQLLSDEGRRAACSRGAAALAARALRWDAVLDATLKVFQGGRDPGFSCAASQGS